jgi:deoxyribodipyrimidine photo-lyase
LPELAEVPDEYVHEPHRMSRDEQEAAGCIIGADYPKPVVNLKKTYERVQELRRS